MRRRESSAFLTSRAGLFPVRSSRGSVPWFDRRRRPFPRPDLSSTGQARSGGVKDGRRPPAEPARHASWTPPPRACHADPGRGVDPDWAAHASGILGLCHCEAHLGITLYPVGRTWPPEPQSLMHDEDRPGTNGTHLRKRSARGGNPRMSRSPSIPTRTPLTPSGRAQPRALRNQAALQIAPQRHHQLAGNRDDADAPNAALQRPDPLHEPPGQGALRLVAHPQPSQLDRQRAGARIAALADPLLAPALSAVGVPVKPK